MRYGTLCYLESENKVLMLAKNNRDGDPNSGLYTLPGGKPEEGEIDSFYEENLEGIIKSAIREFKEETGLTLSNMSYRGKILFDNSERKFSDWKNPDDFMVYIFVSNEYSGNLNTFCDEGRPFWIKKGDVPILPQHVGDFKIFEWIEDGKFFEGIIKQKGDILDEEETLVNYLDSAPTRN